METFFGFLLKASAGMVLFYTVYWIFLRKETYFSANRRFLLAALITSVLIPLFPLQYQVQAQTVVQSVSEVSVAVIKSNTAIQPVNTATSYGWKSFQLILIIYLSGFLFFLLRLLIQSVMLLKMIIALPSQLKNGLRVIENNKFTLPFSFFNIVFINPEYHKQTELTEILAHEEVHILEHHWFDLLVVELLTVIFWFNPFIWFFERSIKQNHEYLADAGVLSSGHAVGRYQTLLVNQLMGMQVVGITNNLRFALNETRFNMMTKMKTSKTKKMKMIWAIPVLAILMYAFAEPRNVSYKSEKTDLKTFYNFVNELIIKGKVVRESDGKPIPGVSVILKGTTMGTITDIDGEFKVNDFGSAILEKLNSDKITLVFSFVGLKTIEKELSIYKNNDNRTYIIDKVILKEEYIGIGQIDNSPPVAIKEKIKKEEVTSNPSPVMAEKTNSDGVKEQIVFFVVEEMPEFPGGSLALENLMKEKRSEFMESESYKGSNLSGKKVFIGFTVDANGSVINPVLTGPNVAGYTIPEISQTVKQKIFEMVTEMPKWSPGKQRGKPVPVKYMIPFVF